MIQTYIVNIVLISICIFIHYEFLLRLSIILPKLKIRPRLKVLWGLLGALVAHVMEIWVFAVGYYLCTETQGFGELKGNIQHTLLDYAYYSFATYTSLGIGDIIPTGELRFLTGLEALIGLVMITWSASFMYYQMERFWQDQ